MIDVRLVLRATVLPGVLMCGAAWAQAPDIMVMNAWARATSPSQRVGGVFLTIMDHGGADRLLSASSPVAGHLELHETVNDGGVMKMQPVPALPVASGQSLELKPGGYHLMAMELKQQLVPGASFPVTLHFEKAGDITAMATIGTAGAAGPAMDHASMGGMPMPTKP